MSLLVVDPEAAVVGLRVFNTGSSGVLLMITLWVCVIRWRGFRPSQRLFAIGFVMYVAYAVASTLVGLVRHAAPNPSTPLLAIANVWLIGAVVILQVEYAKGLHDGDL